MHAIYSHADGNGGIVAFKENLAANLKRLLAERGLKQKDLARITGLSQPSISGWMKMKDWPAPENLEKVIAAFGVKPEELFKDPVNSVRPKSLDDDLFEDLKMFAKRAGYKVTKKS